MNTLRRLLASFSSTTLSPLNAVAALLAKRHDSALMTLAYTEEASDRYGEPRIDDLSALTAIYIESFVGVRGLMPVLCDPENERVV